MCPHLKLFTRVFIFVRCPNNSINAFFRRQRDRPRYGCTGSFGCFHDFTGRLIKNLMIKSLQTNTDFLFRHAFPSFKRLIFRLLRKNYRVKPATFCFIVILGCPYSGQPGNTFIAATAAHKKPGKQLLLNNAGNNTGTHCAAALANGKTQTLFYGNGVISSMVIWTLSPGMTITPSRFR